MKTKTVKLSPAQITRLKKLWNAYKKNQQRLGKALPKVSVIRGKAMVPKTVDFRAYRRRVEADRLAKGTKRSKSARTVLNSEIFQPRADRSKANIINALRTKFPKEYLIMRNIMRDNKGHFTSYDSWYSKMEWDRSLNDGSGAWKFADGKGKEWYINVTNSPMEMSVEEAY